MKGRKDMRNKVNLSDITKEVALDTKFGKKSTVDPIVRSLISKMSLHLKEGHDISLMGLGTFHRKENKPTTKYNTNTNKSYISEGSFGVRFKASDKIKEIINDKEK